ncbi:MAG: PDZ domain-containing protein [Clostridia bacterium]|nr:PDZ domain-containing protein [Clostridia bacterium]
MTKKIPFSVFVLGLVVAMLFAFMSGFAVADNAAQGNAVNQNAPADTSQSVSTDKLKQLAQILNSYSYYKIDEETLCQALIGGFTEVVGDDYARYYNAEDYKALMNSSSGSTQGIGITVINNQELNCIEIILVSSTSPAAKAGLQIGDLITHVGTGESKESVADLGYDKALEKLAGAAGTYAQFTVKRGDEMLDFNVERVAFTADSVLYHVCKTDASVGIIKIMEFNLPTPKQFCTAMDALIAAGCTRFVFDVRSNPGGDLRSIGAVLSYMLQKDDVFIRTADREGEYADEKVTVISNLTGAYEGCNVSESDIGKYRNYVLGKSAVITNGHTASAAELFTSALMDYDIATVVGTKTYGKGSMQSIFSLAYYGFEGGIKLTTKKYFPPISEGYDGIGIFPDVQIELDDAIKNKNLYTLSDEEDNQLQAAIAAIGNK